MKTNHPNRYQKTLLLLTLIFVWLFSPSAIAQNITLPRDVSQAAVVKQTVGLATIKVSYSRPSVFDKQGNDRTGKIWGGLVPYGFNVEGFGNGKPIPWRAGANENTTIYFSHDVKVEGKPLKAGTYGLHIAVQKDGSAIVIFSNNSTSWGSYFYEESEDALRVNIKTTETAFTKMLTYHFTDVGANYTVLALDWEKKQFPVRIDVDVTSTTLANIRNELRSTGGFSWQGYMSAAQFCVNNKTNQEEAVKWIDKSISMNKNVQNLTVKSQLMMLKGDVAKSNQIIDEAADMADISQLNTMGYQLMNMGNADKAVEIFKLNVKRNPDDANCHDSLGEGLMAKGENDMAIRSFKKSLSLNPPDNVKNNSLKNLKALGVEL
jgi:hypothetical protein